MQTALEGSLPCERPELYRIPANHLPGSLRHNTARGEHKKKIVVENGVISKGSTFSNNFSKNSLKFKVAIEFSPDISKPIVFFNQPSEK